MNDSDYEPQITWNSSESCYDFSGRPSGTAADWENRPVNYVSQSSAFRFCNWMTSDDTESGAYRFADKGDFEGIDREQAVNDYSEVFVIPNEDEWFKAAYYNPADQSYYDYPTASNSAPDSESPPGGSNSANYNDSGFALGAPFYRSEVGAYSNSPSPYNTFDQGGNVAEWNQREMSTRGGNFTNSGDFLKSNVSVNYSILCHKEVGFRVVAIPEPSSMVSAATIAVFVMGLLRVRRALERRLPRRQ